MQPLNILVSPIHVATSPITVSCICIFLSACLMLFRHHPSSWPCVPHSLHFPFIVPLIQNCNMFHLVAHCDLIAAGEHDKTVRDSAIHDLPTLARLSTVNGTPVPARYSCRTPLGQSKHETPVIVVQLVRRADGYRMRAHTGLATFFHRWTVFSWSRSSSLGV